MDTNEAGVGVGYAYGQLARALVTAAGHDEPGARERARERAERWRAVLRGIDSGALRIGSRVPVADLPVWATAAVVHGGFATGVASAGGPLLPHETALAASAGVPAERGALFAHLLTDGGQEWLTGLLDTGRYRVDLPEEAALLVVAWLARAGERDKAVEVAEEIAPWGGRLRFTPVPVDEAAADTAESTDAVVWRRTAGQAKGDLEQRRPRPRIEAMREALTVWNPFADDLLRLWLDSNDDDGVPARRVDDAWRTRATAMLARYHALAAEHTHCSKHRKPKENLAILRSALAAIVTNGELTPRTAGRLRHAVAAMVRKRGEPGSAGHRALRAGQAAVAAVPTHVEIAREVAGRLATLPARNGVADIDAVIAPVGSGFAVPEPIARVARRAWAAPVADLIRAGIVPSAEVLAELVPRITASVTAAAYLDPALQRLMAATYRAFRTRRSVLLLNLEHQVRVGELPWVAAVERYRSPDNVPRARAAVRTLGELAVDGFPGTLLPNPLIQELSTLSRAADDRVPWVEELAADIFMGAFSAKFLHAAQVAADLLQGSLYERYYGIDYAAVLAIDDVTKSRYGASTSQRFDRLCADRAAATAAPAGRRRSSSVAANGTVIEQGQILTTHNLATLVAIAGVRPRTGWPGLADRAFAEVTSLVDRADRQPRALASIKNAAFAWRSMIFYATIGDVDGRFVDRLRATLDGAREPVRRMLRPAVAGLAHAVDGGTFHPDGTAIAGDGRRFLGWTVGRHPLAGSGGAA